MPRARSGRRVEKKRQQAAVAHTERLGNEELATFVGLESAVKLDRDKDTNWILFDPNELQRFAQQKGGMMRKRRGKVLKRLCRSSYYCGSRNSDRESP
jgi:hypothetical protein